MKQNELYKELHPKISHYCKSFGYKFGIDISDLLSEANLFFIKACKKYYYPKISLQEFVKVYIYKNLQAYCLKISKIEKEKQKLLRELSYRQEILENETIEKKYPEDNLVRQIIDFCLQLDVQELIKPFLKEKNRKKIPAYAIREFFHHEFCYSYNKIDKSIKKIKYLLQNNLI